MLTPETLREHVSRRPEVKEKLDELSDRGLILNTWQVSQLLFEDVQGVGKTTLSYIKYETYLSDNSHSSSGTHVVGHWEAKDYDPDATTNAQAHAWLQGFMGFLADHYSDKYSIKLRAKGEIGISRKDVKLKEWWY